MPVVRRGNSKNWYIQFQLGKRTVIRSARTPDRWAALRLEPKVKANAYSEIILGRKNPQTLENALERFVTNRADTPNHANLKSHKNTVLRILKGTRLIGTLTKFDLEHFKSVRLSEGCSGQTIKHGLNMIVGALQHASADGYDAPELRSPSVSISKQRTRFLTADEERSLLEALNPKREGKGLAEYSARSDKLRCAMQDAHDLVVILLDTGARYGEIANILWEQIDLANRVIRLWRPKVQNESVIFMSDRVFDVLSRRASARTSSYVFTNSKGGPRGYQVTSITKAMRRARLYDCSVHTLRHTHASRLIQNGMSVYEVKEVLGHTDIKTTMRYAHLEQMDITRKARDVINILNDPRATGTLFRPGREDIVR